MGREGRRERIEFAHLKASDKEEERTTNRNICQRVRTEEKSIHLILSRVKEQKKHQVEEAKLERLMTELAEKEEIKVRIGLGRLPPRESENSTTSANCR